MSVAILTCILCTGFAVCPAARAQAAPATVLLEDLTWTELRDRVRAGRTTIIIPIGGTEQNGPHMALGKHNVRVEGACRRRSRARSATRWWRRSIAYVPEGGVAPPTAHMRFPGTITVPERRPSKRSSNTRHELQAARLSRHRVPRRSRRLSEGRQGGRRSPEPRVGGDARARACDRRVLPGDARPSIRRR